MDLKGWLSLVATIGPMIAAAFGAKGKHIGEEIATVGPLVVDGIGQAEQMDGATGAEKKAHVLSIVSDAVTSADTIANKPFLDAGSTLQTASVLTDAIVSVANTVRDAHDALADAPPPAATT